MDYNEIISPTPDCGSHRELLLKWLPILLYCTIASIITSIITAFLGAGMAITLLSAAVSVVNIVALFQLAPVNERYRKAAIFSAVSVGGSILILLMPGLTLFTLVGSICSVVASYQMLNGHSEITAPMDMRLSRKWHAFFYYEFVIGLVSGFLSSAGVVIGVLADVDPQRLVTIILIFTVFVSAVLALVRISYLKRTIDLCQEG